MFDAGSGATELSSFLQLRDAFFTYLGDVRLDDEQKLLVRICAKRARAARASTCGFDDMCGLAPRQYGTASLCGGLWAFTWCTDPVCWQD